MDQERNLRPLDCQEVKTMFFSCQKHQRGNKDASTWSIPIWWHFSDERWDREWLMSSVHAEEQKKREPNRTCWELSDSSVLLEYSPIGSGSPSFVSAALIRALNFWVKLSSLFKTKKKKKKHNSRLPRCSWGLFFNDTTRVIYSLWRLLPAMKREEYQGWEDTLIF